MRWRYLAGAVGAALLAVVGANLLVTRRAEARLVEAPAEAPARSVAIVLGARVWADGSPSATLADRLACGLALYEAGRVDAVLVSGDHGRDDYDEATAMFRWLTARGVPAERVFVDHAGFRTLDSMERAARVFRVRDAVVCTQRFHLARSVFLARRAGIDAVGVVADRRVYRAHRTNQAREVLARTAAVVDSYLLRREPRFLGPPIPIEGSAAPSHRGLSE